MYGERCDYQTARGITVGGGRVQDLRMTRPSYYAIERCYGPVLCPPERERAPLLCDTVAIEERSSSCVHVPLVQFLIARGNKVCSGAVSGRNLSVQHILRAVPLTSKLKKYTCSSVVVSVLRLRVASDLCAQQTGHPVKVQLYRAISRPNSPLSVQMYFEVLSDSCTTLILC